MNDYNRNGDYCDYGFDPIGNQLASEFYKINPDFKNYMGKVAYYIAGIEETLHLRAFNIKVKSDTRLTMPIYKGESL